MEIKKSSRERLLEVSAHLFKVNGYHNTSIADIAAACNLRKASIYHHINSKKELGIAVLEQSTSFFTDNLFSIAYDTQKTKEERLIAFANAIVKFFKDHPGGSIIGNFALEILNTMPDFEPFIRVFFDDWTKAIASLLVPKYSENQAIALAQDNAAFAQGCIMLCRVYKTPMHLLRWRNQTLELLGVTVPVEKEHSVSCT